MEYTELADYPVSAGTVTEWTPIADPTAWADDPRPVSPNHESHLRARIDRPAGTNEWIGGIWRLPHRFDAQTFRRTVSTWIGRHEALRTEVAVDDGRVNDGRANDGHRLRRSTAPGAAIDARGERVRGGELSGHRVYQHLKDYFDSGIRATSWPHCLLATIESASDPDGFTVAFGADHTVMDAYSQLLAICEITVIYAADAAGLTHDLPEPGSAVEHASIEAQRAALVDGQHPAVTAWHRFLAAGEPRFPMPLVDSAAPPNQRLRQSSLSTWLLGPDQVTSLDARIKAEGGKFAAAMIAALALAQARLSGEPRLRFVMPMHTRTQAQWALATGWFVGLMPVDLELPAAALEADGAGASADALARVLAPTATALAAHRGLEQVPYPTVAEHLGLSAPRLVISYVDGRFTPGVADWPGWRARVLRSESTAGDELYLWLGRTPRGLNLSTRFPSNPVAAEAVYSVIAELREILLAAAGGGTGQAEAPGSAAPSNAAPSNAAPSNAAPSNAAAERVRAGA